MKTITIEQIEQLAMSNGLEVIEDIYVSLTNGNEAITVYRVSCMTLPPYSALYNRKEVESVINKLMS